MDSREPERTRTVDHLPTDDPFGCTLRTRRRLHSSPLGSRSPLLLLLCVLFASVPQDRQDA
jgi:hypothetical protein